MTDWKIQSYANTGGVCLPASQWYTFPIGYVLNVGRSVSVHAGTGALDAPPDDLKWTGSFVWNDQGDVGVLYDASGGAVDSYCYGECCSG